MITETDVRALRFAHSVFNRRGIDITRADVRMMHGVLHVKGNVRRTPGVAMGELREEFEHAVKVIRAKPEVREVCLDVTFEN